MKALGGCTILAAIAVLAAGPAAHSQDVSDLPTSYLAEFDGTAEGTIAFAARGKPLVEVTLRPASAVTLQGDLDAQIASAAAVDAGFPFVAGTTLYGSDGDAGLFCDLMRNRGLGSSAACLRDKDGDGVFDTAVRFDFNSGGADRVFLTDKGKVRGGNFKKEFPLAQGIAYSDNADGEMPTGRVSLFWESPRKRKDPSDAPALVQFMLTDGINFTGTEILSRDILVMRYTGGPTTADFLGNTITVHGFGEKGEIRYSVTAAKDPATIGFVFRGYVVNIIGY